MVIKGGKRLDRVLLFLYVVLLLNDSTANTAIQMFCYVLEYINNLK